MTAQLLLRKEGCSRRYVLAASPIEGGAENQCVVTALGVSDDAPELPQRNMIFSVQAEAGLAILKKMLVQLPGNRDFKEA
jgi:hypothetical protein